MATQQVNYFTAIQQQMLEHFKNSVDVLHSGDDSVINQSATDADFFLEECIKTLQELQRDVKKLPAAAFTKKYLDNPEAAEAGNEGAPHVGFG